MQSLSNSDQSTDRGKVQNQSGNNRDGYQDAWKKLATEANSVDLLTVLTSYGLRLDKYHSKCICPLHNENSPSFYYYPNTNSWYCFGCKKGGSATHFVSRIEGISIAEASEKLLGEFTPGAFATSTTSDYLDRQDVVFGFSTLIRKFIQAHSNNPNALQFVERLTLIFDTLAAKHNLSNDGFKLVIRRLEKQLGEFRSE